MKFCKDCKWFKPYYEDRSIPSTIDYDKSSCSCPDFNTTIEYISLVSGEKVIRSYKQPFCSNEREYFGRCTEEGIYFEPKENK